MTEATFNPTIDSFMDLENPASNNGGSATLLLGSRYFGSTKTQLGRVIYNFNVSALVGLYASIDAAQLELTFVGSAGATNPDPALSTLYRCTRPATVTENGVTWDKYDGSNAWTTGGGDYDASTPTPVAFNIASGATSATITGLLAFVTDAITNRSNIVSLIHRIDDESARSGDGPQGFSADSKEEVGAGEKPILSVTYTRVAGGSLVPPTTPIKHLLRR
jgi:hypothetical protein